MKWRFEDILTFINVVEAGSVTSAATRLNISKSVISKRIGDLETALRVELFRRSTGRLTPTELAWSLYERVVPLVQGITEATQRVSERTEGLSGRLRMVAPVSFGTNFLGQVIADFARCHPELEIAVDFEDRLVNPTQGGYDLGIHIGDLKESSLKARKLCDCSRIVCCSPEYSSLRAGIDRRKSLLRATAVLAGLSLLVLAAASPNHSYAQEQTSSAGTPHRESLSEREMEVLVARIALYPDELVAAIAAASLYPLQIVEAERNLERVKTDPKLKPDKDWDGSVISLMNYPEIVKMMSDDLEWTQQLGEAVAYQQKDMLEAIQQLRERAVAKGIIKSDDKTVVVEEHEKVIIKSAQADKVYIPVYRSEDLYDSGYASKRVSYYSDSYSSYYDPTATYYAGYVTGAAWAAAVDWYEGETWSGYGRWGKDVEINCDDCFNDRTFNGDISLNRVDWTKVDSSRVTFDKSQLTRLDHNTLFRNLKADGNNSLTKRAAELKLHGPEALPDSRQLMDGKSVLEGLKSVTPGDRFGEIGRTPGRLAKPFAGKPGIAGARSKPLAGSRTKPMAGKLKSKTRIGARPRHPAPKRDIMRGRDPRAFSHGPRHRGPTRGGKPQFKRPIRGGGGLAGPPRPNVPSGLGGPPMPPFGGPPRL